METQGNTDIEMHKALFIYRALKNGWTVRMLPDGSFEFEKGRQKTSDLGLENYIENFVKNFLNINHDKKHPG